MEKKTPFKLYSIILDKALNQKVHLIQKMYLLIIYFRREDLMRNVDEIKSLIKNSSKFQQILENEKGGHTLRKIKEQIDRQSSRKTDIYTYCNKQTKYRQTN